MDNEVVYISTLHNGSGSFSLAINSDNTGLLEIFGKTLTIKLVRNKLEVSDKLAAKDFKYGAEDRDYLLKWLYNEMMENKR